MKIVITGGVCIYPRHRAVLERLGELVFINKIVCNEHVMSEAVEDADILISSLCLINRSVIEHASKLRLIVLATTGFDGVDLEAAARKKIVVCYTPGYATQAVAEHTIGLLLAAARMTYQSARDVACGVYDPCHYVGRQLGGKTLGIVGSGRIGSHAAKIAQEGLGMKVVTVDKDSTRADFEQLLAVSDAVSLHVPLTKTTSGMIGKSEFALMKDSAIFVNTARGRLVDEKALVRVLSNGKLFAAGLDVLANEPMQSDDPLVRLKNVVVTPHVAFNADGALEKRSEMVVESVTTFVDGKEPKAMCSLP